MRTFRRDRVLVLAGPGSGKTRVVVHRCAYLLRVKRALPRNILILCFNRNAANSLRSRLMELVGADARGVTVLTYHGLAMRLTGTSFAERAQRRKMETGDFETLIPDAVRLLTGEEQFPGFEGDELRERLLAGFRYILVDEYQDIDQDQYQLVSALAGRTLSDPDSKLALLAVGDDDQNIYTFRGAKVDFIRRFQDDYRARNHFLVENYRSTSHIIAAANCLIAHNHDRMKTGNAICINKGRQRLPAGGPWENLDPLAQGRVQVLRVFDAQSQAVALVEELFRLKQLNPSLHWTDCAVLARTSEELFPVRALCEHRGVPVSCRIDSAKTPPLYRIREVRQFFGALNLRHDELLASADLFDLLDKLSVAHPSSTWWKLLREVLQDWREEKGDAHLPVSFITEYLYDVLTEQRREQSIGAGIFLSTVHCAKGMEFSHVFVPGGGWTMGKNRQVHEEERRIYYVAMTRAKETLSLFERKDAANPHTRLIEGDFLLTRDLPKTDFSEREILSRRYDILGMEDLFLDFAGRRQKEDPIHAHLSALKSGDLLQAVPRGDHVDLHDVRNNCIAQLNAEVRRGADAWTA